MRILIVEDDFTSRNMLMYNKDAKPAAVAVNDDPTQLDSLTAKVLGGLLS